MNFQTIKFFDILLHVTTMLLRVVTCYYITLDFYEVFVALTNRSSNTRMTDLFMLSYIASLPKNALFDVCIRIIEFINK